MDKSEWRFRPQKVNIQFLNKCIRSLKDIKRKTSFVNIVLKSSKIVKRSFRNSKLGKYMLRKLYIANYISFYALKEDDCIETFKKTG